MTISMFKRNLNPTPSASHTKGKLPNSSTSFTHVTNYHLTSISSAITSPLLPPEIIEAIIDEVGLLNDTPTLKSCSLVATPFVFRAQSHIFRFIDLDRRVPRGKYHEQLHRLLLSKPHLGLHVRQIRIGDDAEDEFGGGSRRGGGNGWGAALYGATAGGWILSSKTLPITLQLLPRLEGFSLSFNSEMTNWKLIPPETRSAIERLFRLPSLKAVSLEFISMMPVQLLLSLVRLRYLGLSCVEVEPWPTSTNLLQGRWETHLESLFLRGTSPLTIQAVSQALALSPPTLKKLSITPTFEDGFCDTISELIHSTGSDITEFEWLPSIHFCTSVGSINMNALPHLRVVRFLVSFRKAHVHGPFPEVLRLLGQIADSSSSYSSHIETIIFDCHCIRSLSGVSGRNGPASSTNADLKSLLAEWRPLDKLLSRPSSFPSLRHIQIRLSTSTSLPASREKFINAFQYMLPALQSKGINISVQTKEDSDERFVLDDFRS